MTELPNTLRVGTLNVQGLAHKLGAVLHLAKTAGLHILCLQETHLSQDSLPAVVQAAAAAGWVFHEGSQSIDSRGAATAGVAFLTAWPCTPVHIPVWEAAAGRVSALRVFRPQQRPLLLVNVYLHAYDAFLAASLLQEVMHWAVGLGEHFCITGDFNIPKCHWPTADALASGALYDADCAAGDPESLPGTHRNPDGVLTGYVIDYMLHVPAVHVFRRDQRPAVADHDLVSYDIQVAALPEQYCWPAKPCVLPTAEISDEIWRGAWAPCEAGFKSALQQQDVTRAWGILSGCFAVLLTKRGAWTPPTQPKSRESCAHRRAPTFQSLTERQLRRLARRAHEFTTCNANARLVSAIDRSVRELVSNFSSLAAQPLRQMQKPASRGGGQPLVRALLISHAGLKPLSPLNLLGIPSNRGKPHFIRNSKSLILVLRCRSCGLRPCCQSRKGLRPCVTSSGIMLSGCWKRSLPATSFLKREPPPRSLLAWTVGVQTL